MEDSTGKSGKYLDDFGLNYFWSKLKKLFSKKTNILDPEYVVRSDNDDISTWSSKITWKYSDGKFDYKSQRVGITVLFSKFNRGSFHYRAYYQSGLVKDGSIIFERCENSDVNTSNKTVNKYFNIGDVPFVLNTTDNSVGLLEYSYNGDVDRKIYKIEGWFNLHTSKNTTEPTWPTLRSTLAPRETSLSDYSGATLYLDCIGDLGNINNYVDIPYHNFEGNNNPKIVYTFGDQTISGTKTFDHSSKIIINASATTTFSNAPTFEGGQVKFAAPPEYSNGHIGASEDNHCFVTSGGLYDEIKNLQSGDIAGKQDTITGAASTAVSDNFTASRAVISNSSGKLGVSDVTSTELGYLDGVTSNVQTQINGKQATISGGATTITSSNLTASRALISNSSGKVAVSGVTSTELGYLDGVTSNVQTQLNAKAASSDLSKYLPLAGGTVTGNIKIDNPCINIGCGYDTGHGVSSTKTIKFFSITLNSSAWGQNAIYDLTYAGKNGFKCYGHLICKTAHGGNTGAVAEAKVYLYNYGIVGTFNAFYYVRSSDTVVDFYYSANDYSNLIILDVKCTGSSGNKGTFSKTTVSSLPTGYVQASLISFGASSGSKGSSTQPIYINSSSQPTTCSTYAGGTKVTLNGTDKGASTASFYAPTAVGSKYSILTSNGSGAPSWVRSISPDAIELYMGGSTSAGHGGYIDFHYNASTDYTSRIIEYSNYIHVLGKLMIQAGTKYLGEGDSYTVTSTDGYYFIRSDAANTITVPAGSGIHNRNLYVLSMIAGSTLTYHTNRINDFAMGDVSLIMIPGKVYHLIAFDGDTWYLMNDVDNEHNSRGLNLTASGTLADLYVRNIALHNGLTLTLPSSQAVQDRELMIYAPDQGTSPTIKYQVPAGADAYSTMTLKPFHCVKFIALSGYWYPMVNA